MNETKGKTEDKNQETVEDIYADKTESNNARFDIDGNMTTWRVHETYIGTGNHTSLWDDILREKRAQSKAEKTEKQKSK